MTSTKIDTLKLRAQMYRSIRAFFARLDYLEVDTPLLGKYTNPDAHIQSVTAQVNGRRLYLQTSPEFCMKQLLSQGSGSIYQICHAFRDEESGNRHSPEFTLLEWYSLGFDYGSLMDQVEELVCQLFPDAQNFSRVSYGESFMHHLGLDVFRASDCDCRHSVSLNVPGIDPSTLSRDDCLDLLISQVIAPCFEGFTFVYDYPASMASLAKINATDPQVAERFELFYNDLELANGFTELTDAAEQKRRFDSDNIERRRYGLPECELDVVLIQALEEGLPECAGVALGLDRLLMVITGFGSIRQIQSNESGNVQAE